MRWRGDEYLAATGWADASVSPGPLEFLSTAEGEGFTVDLWARLQKPPSALGRVTAVVTVACCHRERADPFIPWAATGLLVIAWYADCATTTPNYRLLGALWQGHERARARFTDAQFSQVWPPA